MYSCAAKRIEVIRAEVIQPTGIPEKISRGVEQRVDGALVARGHRAADEVDALAGLEGFYVCAHFPANSDTLRGVSSGIADCIIHSLFEHAGDVRQTVDD